jgi:ADP-ribose pyrophosphatase YjhB (NUDIX family)
MKRFIRFLLLPGLFVVLPFTKRTRVLVRSEGCILLVMNSLGETAWSLPGGGLHRHEAPTEGAVRELREETGVVTEASALRHLYSGWHREGILRFYSHFFVLDFPRRSELTKQRFEIADAIWQPLETLHEIPVRQEVLRALQLLSDK